MTVRFGPFTLDSAGRRLLRGREPVHLTPKAFELIHLLVTEAPRVVSKPNCTIACGRVASYLMPRWLDSSRKRAGRLTIAIPKCR